MMSGVWGVLLLGPAVMAEAGPLLEGFEKSELFKCYGELQDVQYLQCRFSHRSASALVLNTAAS